MGLHDAGSPHLKTWDINVFKHTTVVKAARTPQPLRIPKLEGIVIKDFQTAL